MAIDFEVKNPLADVAVDSYSNTIFVDIDGDKDLDAFVGNRNGTVGYWENVGNPEEPDYRERTGNKNPFDGVNVGLYSQPAFVDIDGDKDLDAFFGNINGEVIYYENTRNWRKPRFEQSQVGNPLSGVDVGAYSVPVFVDINKDGDYDVFIGNSDGTVSYYQNTGNKKNPKFKEQTGKKNPFDGYDIGDRSAPTFIDIDNDKDYDAFVGNRNGTVELYENTGTKKRPTFSQVIGSKNPVFSYDIGDYSIPTFADIDNDKDYDFFVGKKDGTVDYLENIGEIKEPEFFTNPLELYDVGNRNIPTLIDIDGDEDLDAVIGNSAGNINYLENIGTTNQPRFYQPVATENPFWGINDRYNRYNSSPAFVDIDNDGDYDAFSGYNDGNIIFYENVGAKDDPRFARSKAVENPFNGLNVGNDSTPTFVDIDNDGDYDAFSGNRDGNISYFRNNGTQKRPRFALIAGGPNPLNGVDVGEYSKIAFVDVDDDQDYDALIGNKDGTVRYFQNTGTIKKAKFKERTGNANPLNGIDVGTYSAPAFGDLDGDTDLDAFVGNWDGVASFYENTWF
ncbi:MAG: FG-GAP-like repeat-containing protein [Okeania sp.]|nr:FG-GAP-like repeat-containing protein [Okeania sp.]MEB3343491.1 FG-GAP-like repeat-containing protein [Okeania sp.]